MTDWLKKALLILILLTLAGCGRHRSTALSVEPNDAPSARAISSVKPPVAPAEFDVKVWPGGRREITWKDDMAGDYNLDLSIDGKDLFLLAVHFNEESNFNGHSATEEGNDAIDGNRDGELNGLDLFLISSRFNSSISGYRLFTSMTIDGPYDEQFGDDVPLSEEYPFGDYLVEQPDNFIAPLYFKVAAIDETGETGTMHEYRPKQCAVWLEGPGNIGYPVIGAIDGTGKRWLIPQEDFDNVEEWMEYSGCYWVYQATNGSVILCYRANGLIVYWTATGDYEYREFPEGIGQGAWRGQLKLSGDGSRYFVGGEDPEDPEALKYFWFDLDGVSTGMLPRQTPPGLGISPNEYLYIFVVPDSGSPPEVQFVIYSIDSGEMKVIGPCVGLKPGYTDETYRQGMKLAGDGTKAVYVATPEWGTQADQSLWLLDCNTDFRIELFGPVESGSIEYPEINWDGSRVTFAHDKGLFQMTYYTAIIDGESVSLESFEMGNELFPGGESTPDLEKALFFQYLQLDGSSPKLDLRNSDGEQLSLFRILDEEYTYLEPLCMMGN